MFAVTEQLFAAAFLDPTTKGFFYIISTVFLVGLAFRMMPISFFQNISAVVPNILTTLGILGTFLGIAIGLLNFDVSNIDGSVPELLAGLKIAFLTSIFGITASLLLKILQLLVPVGGSKSNTSPESIHATLEGIRDDAKANAKIDHEGIKALRDAIASEGDGSLISQIQKLRTENRDGQKELVGEFRQFAEQMAENNQKALIEALKEVISDFNENLTEQFGENFKELNKAVFKLVEWQENYRIHLEGMEQKIELALNSVDSSKEALQVIQENVSAIPEALKPLPESTRALAEQVGLFEQHLEAISALRGQALEAFPIIENNLQKITTNLADHVSLSIDKTNEALERHTANYKTLEEGFESLQRMSANSQQTFNAELTKALDSVNAQVTATITKHAELIDSNSKAAQKSIDEVWQNTRDQIDSQFKTLDDEMQKELSRAIEAMGQKLAALSEKFVDDYQPLTERLREVVRMAGSARA
ncbi:hypothetical protein FMN50_25375 [Rhodobacterales bacterium]|nr:hypothetical protein FMN50_25375 [Rhodobacterales bacterium]